MKSSRRDFIAKTAACFVAPVLITTPAQSRETIEDRIEDMWRNYYAFDPLSLAEDAGSDIFTRQVSFLGVDLKCLIDTSTSIKENEYHIQRHGIAQSLRSEQVKDAILSQGGIAFSLSEFEGSVHRRIPHAILQSESDINLIADITDAMIPRPIRTATGMAFGIAACREDFNHQRFFADRKVMDISGDGADNVAALGLLENAALSVRREVATCARQGIVCNGLVMPHDPEAELPSTVSSLPEYYRNYVITPKGLGVEPGFLIDANAVGSFEEAMAEKLMLEIIGELPRNFVPRAIPA